MRKLFLHAGLLASCFLTQNLIFGSSQSEAQEQKVILVVGAPGEEEYGKRFDAWADNWQKAIETPDDNAESKIELVRIGSEKKEQTDFELLKSAIESTKDPTRELWVVLIGHGTDDRKISKFNLRGPDFSAKELNEWMNELTCRVVVINAASSSGSFVPKLRHSNRIVVTATKSPAQRNFARFGQYLSESISDPAYDLDKDQQTSLLEAFIAASSQTQDFYVQDTRLATELAVIDDNGDGAGTPGDWYKGTRVVKKAKKGTPDGVLANQVFLKRRGMEANLSEAARAERDGLEVKLESLRSRKEAMTEEAYFSAIEPILVELAKVYETVMSEQTKE